MIFRLYVFKIYVVFTPNQNLIALPCLPRQISGEAVSIAVPEEFLQAWQEAVSTNSKTAKGHLFQMWCHAGGDWGKNLGINASSSTRIAS